MQNSPSHNTISISDALIVLWRRSWLIALILATCLGTAWFVSVRTPKRWKATAQLLLLQRAAVVVASEQGAGAAPTVESVETQSAMLQSYGMALRTIDWLKNDALAKKRPTDSVSIAPEDLQKSITVAVPNGTNLADVSVEANSPEQAIELVNAVCQAFVEWKKKMATASARDVLANLETRVDRAKAQMLAAEQKEIAYRQLHHLADVSAQQKAAVDQYVTRDNDVARLKQEVASQQARVQALAARLHAEDETLRNTVHVRDDTLVLTLQSQLNDLEIKRASLTVHYAPGHPDVRAVDVQIADTKKRLASAVKDVLNTNNPSLGERNRQTQAYREAQTSLLFAQAQLAAAIQMRDDTQKQLAGIPRSSTEHARLERQADLGRSLYTSLQGSLNSVKLDQDMANGNVQIAQYGYASERPVRPNRVQDLSFGGAAGLLLSLIAVLLLEQSDRRVRNVSSVRDLVSGPVIGMLPRMSSRQMDSLLSDQASPAALEAYSLACANMALAVRSATHSELWRQQVIMVTSAVMGEGKSVTAAALASSMARTGRSVILVDADMRRPAQNQLFNTAEPHGLADVLEGAMSLDDAVVASDIATLSVLHSGRPRVNPTELISQPRMAETIARLREEADVVILDTPACSVVADALLMAPHVDCILHVIGAGQVDQELVRETTEALNAADPKTMLYFVNRAPRDRSRSYYSYGSTVTTSERALSAVQRD